MKTLTTIIVMVLSSMTLIAQDKAIMKNDTVYYQGNKFFVNQPLRLGYGSAASKDFAFVYFGTSMTMTPAPAAWAKQDLLIEKIRISGSKFWVKCKILGAGPMLGNKIQFEVESAVDNKEVIL